MGGDGGAPVVIAGAEIAKRRDPDLCFHLYGREEDIRRELAAAPGVAADSTVVHTNVAVGPNDKPTQAIRRARDSRSEEHTSELQSLMRISHAVFCLKKKTTSSKARQHTVRKY